jgi:hypothetical protein
MRVSKLHVEEAPQYDGIVDQHETIVTWTPAGMVAVD